MEVWGFWALQSWVGSFRVAKGGSRCNPDYEVGIPDVPRRRHSHSTTKHLQTLQRQNAIEWRSYISLKICRGPCNHSYTTDHQTLAIFIRNGWSVQGTCSISGIHLSLEGIFCCDYFFNAHCDLYPEFQMPFFFLSLLPLWPFLSGCSVIVHCVWGWTRANPWSWNGGKHLSGIKSLLSLTVIPVDAPNWGHSPHMVTQLFLPFRLMDDTFVWLAFPNWPEVFTPCCRNA